MINVKQIAKFVVGLGDRVAPADIEEGMRVGVDRNKYQIQIPLPPKIDPTVTMMTVEEKPDITYNDIGGNKDEIQKLREVRLHAARRFPCRIREAEELLPRFCRVHSRRSTQRLGVCRCSSCRCCTRSGSCSLALTLPKAREPTRFPDAHEPCLEIQTALESCVHECCDVSTNRAACMVRCISSSGSGIVRC
eukprot:6186527-Pleurochrysis_carterae.AAC.1